MPSTAVHSSGSSRILAEDLVVPSEPLALLLRPGAAAAPDAVARRAAGALLDLPEVEQDPWPAWLAPHQVPAARRLAALIGRYGGAVLADAVGLGKSYVALAVAQHVSSPLTLVVPSVLVPQWRTLLARLEMRALIVTHESLSHPGQGSTFQPSILPSLFVIVDEAHRFRNPDTNRYRALARLVIGARLLLVTATPVHNQMADLFHLFRLFLRDHALAGLGVSSLARAARGQVPAETATGVAARLLVARSRARVGQGYGRGSLSLSFPKREQGVTVRAATAPPAVLTQLVSGIAGLDAAGAAAPLFRLTLLRRLASSLPALRASLDRYGAFLDLARDAARDGRDLGAADFARLFPRGDDGDVQLVFFPLVLDARASSRVPGDLALVRRLRVLAAEQEDAKVEALERLLRSRPGKTIVFADAQATARHLARRLRRRCRVALLTGAGALLGVERAGRREALAAFAPVAQGAVPRGPAHHADVLIATDLVSEGLNLQDAERVIHYDLPWSPARLAQRVGRVDRLGSLHAQVETIAFLPASPVAEALELEERMAAKIDVQVAAGAAERETVLGREDGGAPFDWCDRLQDLAGRAPAAAAMGCYATVTGPDPATVLVLRLGALVETLVVRGEEVRADPVLATQLLETASLSQNRAPDPSALETAIRLAGPLARARLAAVSEARWRAADRDRLARRLIPWVLTAARRAAKRGAAAELRALDGLVSRLSLGMTAGEELTLERLMTRSEPLAIADLQRWHERLPP
ncbi:MAG TPA: DEAD/DEAH box helicase, partial [Gemmatimonadales bacterium]